MEKITRNATLFGGLLGLILIGGVQLGRFWERGNHRLDYIKISMVKNFAYDESKHNPDWEVQASVGGKGLNIPSLQCYFANARLDKAVEQQKPIEDLEYSAKVLKREVSGATFGERWGGRPIKEIDYDLEAEYHNWENGGYGSGFVSSVKLRPHE